MKDKASTGTTDPRHDHHMIDGQLVRVVEPAPSRSKKARSSKRDRAGALDKSTTRTHAPPAK